MNLNFYLEQTQKLKAQLDEFRPLSADVESRILQKIRLDWNYHSNHLEGNKLTYGETKALILFGMTAQGKPLQDHLEVSGHDEAVKWIEDVVKGDFPLNETFIRQLHQLILKESYTKASKTKDGQIVQRRINVGVYKTTPNHVLTPTGEMFYFASPEETPAKMHDLMAWYAEQKGKKDAILLAAEFHYKFIRIHPFDDGNGRVARLLMNFIMMQGGYPPAIIKTDDKEYYYAALRQADAGILEPFLAYIAQNVVSSLELMLKAARGESIEDPDDLDKQIALLEQKLNGEGEKIEQVKSEEVLMEFSEFTLLDIASEFIQINKKFHNFYVEQKYEFLHYSWEDESVLKLGTTFFEDDFENPIYHAFNSETLDILLGIDTKEEKLIELECIHKTFNRSNIPTFDYTSTIGIEFEYTHYNIIYNNGEKFKKLYHEELTDEEIDYILQKEANRHLAFIQEKMKEQK